MATFYFKNVRRRGGGTTKVRCLSCGLVTELNCAGLELEAQYWRAINRGSYLTEVNHTVSPCLTRKHVEYFPHGIEMRLPEVRALRRQLNWYRVGEFVRIQTPYQNDLNNKQKHWP
jgi:NDP-sugar pyrophosphorylase family protein